MTPAERNLELKARCPNSEAARAAIRALDLRDAFTEHQTDTYFRVPSGRLKLREIDGQAALLLFYDRADEAAARISYYRRAPIVDVAATKALLEAALGIRGVVVKRREIYLWYNVRIHLDDVAGLGTFLEFEAVLTDGADRAEAQGRLDHLCALLAVMKADRSAASYIDLAREM